MNVGAFVGFIGVFVLGWLSHVVYSWTGKFEIRNSSVCSSYQGNSAPKQHGEESDVVDIFYLIIKRGNAEHKKHEDPMSHIAEYISRNYFWSLPYVNRNLARKRSVGSNFETDTRIHIVSNVPSILRHGNVSGYFVHDFSDFKHRIGSITETISRGVSSLEYEVTLYRWIIYDLIAHDWNVATKNHHHNHSTMKRIYSLDLDVLLLENAASFYDRSVAALSRPSRCPLKQYNDTSLAVKKHTLTYLEEEGFNRVTLDVGYDYISYGLGAISLMSRLGLRLFAEEVVNWFNTTDPREALARTRAFYPHFSDMILLKWFESAAPERRSSVLESSVRQQVDDPFLVKAIQVLGCLPVPFYKSLTSHELPLLFRPDPYSVPLTKWNSLRVNHSIPMGLYMSPHPPQEGGMHQNLPLCLIHFQGREQKTMYYVYARAFFMLIQNLSNSTEKPFNELSFYTARQQDVEDEDIMHMGFLAHIENSRSVQFIDNHGLRHYLNGDLLYQLQQRNYATVQHLPRSLVEFFPLAPTLLNKQLQ